MSVIKCKAAVAWAPKQPLSIELIEVSPPKKGEVRIKIAATGVCHTDVATIAAQGVPGVFPVIVGHEGAGVVESVGDGVTSVQQGDHVVICGPQCKKCETCKNPKTNLCAIFSGTQAKGCLPDGTCRFSCKGQTVHHYLGASTFSEYTVVPDVSVVKIKKTAPLQNVCLFACCVTTGYGAAVNAAKVDVDSKCAVFGLGAIGLSAVMGCRVAGASQIIAVDINPDKEAAARLFGATHFVNPNDCEKPVQQVLRDMTDGGLDYTFECVGNVDTMRAVFESCHMGWGTATIVGTDAPGRMLLVEPYRVLSGVTMKGTMLGGYIPGDAIPRLIDEYMAGKIMVDELITHRLLLENINEAIDLMNAGKCLRIVIDFGMKQE